MIEVDSHLEITVLLYLDLGIYYAQTPLENKNAYKMRPLH